MLGVLVVSFEGGPTLGCEHAGLAAGRTSALHTCNAPNSMPLDEQARRQPLRKLRDFSSSFLRDVVMVNNLREAWWERR